VFDPGSVQQRMRERGRGSSHARYIDRSAQVTREVARCSRNRPGALTDAATQLRPAGPDD